MVQLLDVIKVTPHTNYTLELVFENGEAAVNFLIIIV